MQEVTAHAVRESARRTYVDSARRNGRIQVTIRAGDIHTSMNLTDQVPLVCAALEDKMFEVHARVQRVSQDGQGTDHRLIFVVLP